MDVSVVSIGNSNGIRLTKAMIKKYNITDTVESILLLRSNLTSSKIFV